MIVGAVVQQPTDILDYDIGYIDWIGETGDSLSSVSVNINGLDEALGVSAQLSGPDTVKLWIQGGTNGQQYTVEINAILTSGRSKQDELIVQVEDF